MRVVRASEQTFIPAAHEDPQQPGVLKRVLARRDELIPGRVQMINWARLPAGSSFRAHYHEDMEEVFIILQGRVDAFVDGQTCTLWAGDTLFIAPREVHHMTNPTAEGVDYIAIGIARGESGQTILSAPPSGDNA